MMSFANQELETAELQPVPPEVALMMSALEAGQHAADERREVRRVSYRTTTQMRLFRDEASTPAWRVYIRDINRRGLGFLSPHRLPLGYGGVVMLHDENGEMVGVQCTLSRCRESSPGWYEGCLYFNREQPHFDSAPEEIDE